MLHAMQLLGVNACCEQEEKLGNDGVDMLFQAARAFTEQVGQTPSLFKADIDSAYRRIPIKPSDRCACFCVCSWVYGPSDIAHISVKVGRQHLLPA